MTVTCKPGYHLVSDGSACAKDLTTNPCPTGYHENTGDGPSCVKDTTDNPCPIGYAPNPDGSCHATSVVAPVDDADPRQAGTRRQGARRRA